MVPSGRAMRTRFPEREHTCQPGDRLSRLAVVNVRRSYQGPVLIRGQQVEGPHRMLFYGNTGQQWYAHGAPELRFSGRYGSHASEFLVPTAGCYGWQIDGIGFSRVLVLNVVRQTPRIG
jgi:hypothetical protein